MELLNEQEFVNYVKHNYDLLFELKTSEVNTEIAGSCDICQRDAFLKIHSSMYLQSVFGQSNYLPRFVTFLIECPRCRRKSFIKTVQIGLDQSTGTKDSDGDEETEYVYQYFKLFRLPTIEESFANKDIPDEYSSLRSTISEAIFCLSHSRNVAAAILFRRAIQIIAKEVLGAQGRTLHMQLNWLRENKNILSIDLADVFHDNAVIIKDIGNQGAHPDDDITLHDFSKSDADGLHDLFISIVHEVFVKPAKLRSLQDDLKKSRKLK